MSAGGKHTMPIAGRPVSKTTKQWSCASQIISAATRLPLGTVLVQGPLRIWGCPSSPRPWARRVHACRHGRSSGQLPFESSISGAVCLHNGCRSPRIGRRRPHALRRPVRRGSVRVHHRGPMAQVAMHGGLKTETKCPCKEHPTTLAPVNSVA